MLANAGYSLCSNNLKIATAIIAQQPVHIPDHIASFHHDSRKPSKTNSFTLYDQGYKYIGVSPTSCRANLRVVICDGSL